MKNILRDAISTRPFLFHHIFKYFKQDLKLAIKLFQKQMNYQDCNQKKIKWQLNCCDLQLNKYSQQMVDLILTLLSLAIRHSYSQIVEILLLVIKFPQYQNEGLSVFQVNLRVMNIQSSTNLKILKEFQKLEIQKTLIEDTSEYSGMIINRISQFPKPKTPYKIIIKTMKENLIQTSKCIEGLNQNYIVKQMIKMTIFSHQIDIKKIKFINKTNNNIIKQKNYKKNKFLIIIYLDAKILLNNYCTKYSNLNMQSFIQEFQLDNMMILFQKQFNNNCYYKNLDYLIEQMLIPIPTKYTYSNFDQSKKNRQLLQIIYNRNKIKIK
ncbi:unnamed protein product [Paramecium sonneborni]|uniref:Uncharacterized protein n=1 Tax=Paramecium sonneborni TaxID=65129 RepID=A0A8S1RNG4_9CILI|nr:unnamed protein product [Paramecium sonneborni]